MGYQITYDRDVIKKKKMRVHKIKWKRVALSVTAAALVVTLALPAGRLWIRDLILPGDEDVTAAALEGLAEDLSAGEPVGEAVETFCREIIAGGT